MKESREESQNSSNDGEIPSDEAYSELSESFDQKGNLSNEEDSHKGSELSRNSWHSLKPKFRLGENELLTPMKRQKHGSELVAITKPGDGPLMAQGQGAASNGKDSSPLNAGARKKDRNHKGLKGRRMAKLEQRVQKRVFKSKPISSSQISKTEFTGPAAKYLQGNQFSHFIEKVVADDELLSRDEAARQVKGAIVGGCPQCSSCDKFHTSPNWQPVHEKKCRSGQLKLYRISFLKLDSRYFCYFGCDQFSKRAELVLHLVQEHGSELKAWGISVDRLAIPGIGNTPGGPRSKDVDSGQERSAQSQHVKTLDQTHINGIMQQGQVEISAQAEKQPKWAPRIEDNVLIRFITFNAVEETSSLSLQGAVDTWQQVWQQGSVFFVYAVDWLRSNPMEAFSLITNLQRIKQLQKSHPQLCLSDVTLRYHSEKIVSLQHHAQVETPIVLYRSNRLGKAHLAFRKALWRLKHLHDEVGLFQGGVELHNIGLTEHDSAYFCDWSYAVPKEGISTRVKSRHKSYCMQAHHQEEEDLFTLDLLALLYSFAELISELYGEDSFYDTIGRYNLELIRDPNHKMDVSQSKVFCGSWELNDLLVKYSKPEPISYHELSKDLDDFFKEGQSKPENPFYWEMMDQRKARKRLHLNRMHQEMEEESVDYDILSKSDD